MPIDKEVHLIYHSNYMSMSRADSNRYKKVLKLRSSGKTFQEIAEELGVSRQRVWQIFDRASRRFTEYVETPKNGENSGISRHIAI